MVGWEEMGWREGKGEEENKCLWKPRRQNIEFFKWRWSRKTPREYFTYEILVTYSHARLHVHEMIRKGSRRSGWYGAKWFFPHVKKILHFVLATRMDGREFLKRMIDIVAANMDAYAAAWEGRVKQLNSFGGVSLYFSGACLNSFRTYFEMEFLMVIGMIVIPICSRRRICVTFYRAFLFYEIPVNSDNFIRFQKYCYIERLILTGKWPPIAWIVAYNTAVACFSEIETNLFTIEK